MGLGLLIGNTLWCNDHVESCGVTWKCANQIRLVAILTVELNTIIAIPIYPTCYVAQTLLSFTCCWINVVDGLWVFLCKLLIKPEFVQQHIVKLPINIRVMRSSFALHVTLDAIKSNFYLERQHRMHDKRNESASVSKY